MALKQSQAGSIILNDDGTNRTGTALSTNILIKVGNLSVGAIQELSVREARSVQMIAELGTDGNIDSAPTKAAEFSGNCTRIRFDRLRIAEAFGRDFVHVQSQRIPFNIVIIDKWNGDAESAVITTVRNVWITGIDYSYKADNFIISESMSWVAETISSTLGTGNKNVANGGERGFTPATNSVEQATDRGGLRGALDTPGLLRAAFSPDI